MQQHPVWLSIVLAAAMTVSGRAEVPSITVTRTAAKGLDAGSGVMRREAETWQAMMDALRGQVRIDDGRESAPIAASANNQSAKTRASESTTAGTRS